MVRLTNIANQAAELKQSLVFLPCHRSHIDYVSLQIICYRLGLALPAVVAGDNLNFPVVGAFLQNAGAFYIRRQMGDDVLYGTMVQAYVDTLLRGGFNMECFVGKSNHFIFNRRSLTQRRGNAFTDWKTAASEIRYP